MNELVVNGFDYSMIDEDARDDVRDAAVRIKVRMARTASDIIDIGRDLIAVKKAVGHGNFLSWINAEFGWQPRAAQRFISVADRFGSNASIPTHLSFEAIATLAAPSTPDEVVSEVTERVGNGETFTAADVKALKAEWVERERDLKLKASRADAIKHDFEQQLTELRDKLSRTRDDNDTLKHELEQARVSSVAALPNAAKPDHSVISSQANAIISAWNRACPQAREVAMEQIDGPVFDRTAAGR